MHPALIGIPLVFLAVYGIVWRINTPKYHSPVFKSKWSYNYRYSIKVLDSNKLWIVLWKRDFWGREVVKSSGIDFKLNDITGMYKDAHELGQKLMDAATSHALQKDKLITFGKQNAKKMNNVVTVSKKLDIL